MAEKPTVSEAWHELVMAIAKALRLDRALDRIALWLSRARIARDERRGGE